MKTLSKTLNLNLTYDFTGSLHDVNDKEEIIEATFEINDDYYETHDPFDCEKVLSEFKQNRIFDVTKRTDKKEKRSPSPTFHYVHTPTNCSK